MRVTEVRNRNLRNDMNRSGLLLLGCCTQSEKVVKVKTKRKIEEGMSSQLLRAIKEMAPRHPMGTRARASRLRIGTQRTYRLPTPSRCQSHQGIP